MQRLRLRPAAMNQPKRQPVSVNNPPFNLGKLTNPQPELPVTAR